MRRSRRIGPMAGDFHWFVSLHIEMYRVRRALFARRTVHSHPKRQAYQMCLQFVAIRFGRTGEVWIKCEHQKTWSVALAANFAASDPAGLSALDEAELRV